MAFINTSNRKEACITKYIIYNKCKEKTNYSASTFPGCLFPKTIVTLANIISYVKEISCIVNFSKRENVHLRANQIDVIIGWLCS